MPPVTIDTSPYRVLGPGTWGQTLPAFRATYGGPDDRAYGARLSTWAWIGKAPVPSDGWEVARWIQTHCRYTDGPRARSLIILRNWQVAEIVEMFRLDEDGQRVYRRGLLGVPRKNGKSMIGAGLALQGLCGDDEFGAEVYGAAGTREQGRVVYREAVTMIKLGKEAGDEVLSRLQVREAISEVLDPATHSRYKVVSSEAFSSEGLKPSRVIFDEVHVQPNHALWDVMSMGSATRDRPFILGITTAGYDKATLCGEMYDAGRAIEEAGVEPESYFSWYEAPRRLGDEELDYEDPQVWALCNPGLGDFFTVDAVRKMELPNGENAFRRYRLNQWTSAISAWLPSGAWGELAVERTLEKDEDVVIALDGSFNNDSTALVACTRDQFIAVLGLWEKPEGDDEWKVPIHAVEDAIRDAFGRYRVQEMGYDPYRWERTAQVIAEEFGEDRVVAFPQTTERLTAATTDFYDAVVRDKAITHDGNPRLAVHIENCRIKETPRGSRITKESKSSPNKIDAAVAAVMAHARSKFLPEGKWNIW